MENKKENKKYWAIDLGTTNSAIAWSNNDKSDVIKIGAGTATSIPSAILATNGEMQVLTKRNKSLYKSLIDGNNALTIEEWKVKGMVTSEAGSRDFESKVPGSTPIKLSSMIIKYLVAEAETKTGEKIEDLSITVPANFSEAARLNTLKAANLACPKLHFVKLIHEPTAAAMSLLGGSYNIKGIKGKKILVFDSGGGTTDISIVKFESNDDISIDANVKGTKGADIAGKVIDSKILNNYIFPIVAKETGISKNDIKKEPTTYQHLMYIAEWLKIQLAQEKDDASTTVSFSFKGRTYNVAIGVNYESFLGDVKKLFTNLLHTMNKLLIESKLSKDDIDIVVAAGGTSKGPWVSTIINEFFGREAVKNLIDPDTAIAVGGSIISATNFNKGIFEYKSNELMVNEITTNNIGIGIVGRRVSWLINKGANIPVQSKTKKYYFTEVLMEADNVTISVYESKKKLSFQNETKLIGVVDIENNKKGKEILLSFKYENDNSLHVNVEQGGSSKEYKVEQSKEIIEKAIREEKEFFEMAKNTILNDAKISELTVKEAIEGMKNLKEMEFDVEPYNDIDKDSEEAKALLFGFKIFLFWMANIKK